MLFFQPPPIVVNLPVASVVGSDRVLAVDPVPSEELSGQQMVPIRGISASGNEVTVEMSITQKRSNYYGRFSYLGKPLQLVLRLTTTELTSAGRTQNITMQNVEELNLDELIEQVGGVENLVETLKIVPAKGSDRWQLVQQDKPYAAMIVDLKTRKVIYDVIQP
jgi:hypothetical protein